MMLHGRMESTFLRTKKKRSEVTKTISHQKDKEESILRMEAVGWLAGCGFEGGMDVRKRLGKNRDMTSQGTT